MSTFTKAPFSAGAHGIGVKVVATGNPGTTIHQAVNSTTNYDEIWAWAWNTDTTARLLTIQWGGNTDPDNLIEITIQPSSSADPVCICPGLMLRNNLTFAAFAAAANVIVINGFVNQVRA